MLLAGCTGIALSLNPHWEEGETTAPPIGTLAMAQHTRPLHSVSFSQILSDDVEGDLLMTHFRATIFSS